MKRITALVLIIIFTISLCACTKDSSPTLEKAEKSTYIDTNTYPEYPPEAARYTVDHKDHTLLDLESQLPIVDAYYDLVTLEGDSDAVNNINALIEADYKQYKERNYIDNLEETFSSLPNYGDTKNPFYCTYQAAVTHNEYNVFSIRIIESRYFGNTATLDAYGLNFNTETGEVLNISELTDMDDETLRQTFVETTWNQIQHDSLYDDAKEILETLALHEYIFYIEAGEIVLSYPCYTFAPGENGAATIHTGVMIKQ